MPPIIAACLYVGFILWLFRRHSKQIAPMSPGSWVAFVWLVIIASRPVGYWFANGTQVAAADVSEGSFIDRNTYLFLIILGLIVLVCRRGANWREILVPGKWILFFYAYLLISATWSPFPFIAFKRWFKDFGNVVMILVILTESDPVEAIRGLFARVTYVLILVSVLFIKYFPDLGRYYNKWSWTSFMCGVTMSKNALGDAAMIGGLFLLWHLTDLSERMNIKGTLRKRWPDLLVLGMCIWILFKAHCETGFACFCLGALAFFGSRLNWTRRHLQQLGWVGLGVVAIMVAFTTLPDFRGAIAGLLNRDVTLTGRTVIWEAVLKIPTNPLLGHGFASTWLSPEGEAMANNFASAAGGVLAHCHNGYLETFLDSGIIGVCLLLMVLVSAGRNAVGLLQTHPRLGYYFMASFLSGLFYNYTEVAFNHGNIVGFVLWLIALFNPMILPLESESEAEPEEEEIEPLTATVDQVPHA